MATIISNGTTFVAVRNKTFAGDELPDGFDEMIGSVEGMQLVAINLGNPGTPLEDVEMQALMRSEDGSFEWKDISEVGQTQPRSAVVRLLREYKKDDDGA